MQVTNISYVQAIRSIRELILDVGLVQCFKLYEQDLSFSKTSTEFQVDTEVKLIGPDNDLYKLYDLIGFLAEKSVKYDILPDYVATEFVGGLIDFDIPKVGEDGYVVKAKHYFTDETIETVMVDFFANYMPFDGIERSVVDIFDKLTYYQKRKLILWVAFHLVDKRRMQMASTSVMIGLANGDSLLGSTFENKQLEVTTRIGEVYTETERIMDDGTGANNLTSLWGDKYSYLTKLQLYIRGKFEKLFSDFSLRDDVAVSQTFTMEKTWQNDAWIDTHEWSYDTLGVLVDNRD